MQKKMPIGISDFKCVVSENYYYVDKSLLIKEVLEKCAAITLISRPRRFGKTLNLSMLQYFFEKTATSHATLFKDLEIAKHPECMKHQGKYPIIFLTLKDVKQDNWDDCYDKLKALIADEYHRHDYLLESDVLHETKKKEFREIINKTANYATFCSSLKELSVHLTRFHNQRPIILLDEYDAPIQHGFLKNYYDKIIDFMRNFMSTALKDNDKNLEFCIITGIMRIAKESVFSGLNNLKVCALTGNFFLDKFGLTEEEVKGMLQDYNVSKLFETVKQWYNGYTLGYESNVKLYNPWSIINFLDNKNNFSVYWVNTSSNDLVKQLIKQDSISSIKEDLDTLLSGGSITKQLNDNVIFSELYNQLDVIWNFLLFTGYLTYKKLYKKGTSDYLDLTIPNLELKAFWENVIKGWFESSSQKSQPYKSMLSALQEGDCDLFEDLFYNFVTQSFSSFDVSGTEPERFYHAFVLGMMVGLGNEFEIKSNRESGYGRYDVMLLPRDLKMHGIIFEFKKVNTRRGETLESATQTALKQIEDKKYESELLAHGVSKNKIFKIAIAFEGKNVLIKHIA